jgi:hypothetical protein
MAEAGMAVFGLATAAVYTGALVLPSSLALFLSAVWGLLSYLVAAHAYGLRASLLACVLAPWPAAAFIGVALLVPVDTAAVAMFLIGSSTAAAVAAARRCGVAPLRWRVTAVATGTSLTVLGVVAGAGAWSVDEPGASDPRMVDGNGVVVDMDTHAFLIQQGAAILAGDGHVDVVKFLNSPDPTAPVSHAKRGASPRATREHESFLWRMQLGARDADRVLKHPLMPDHFFNWWTHSGKGLVAGPSGATYAEQQFSDAVASWQRGDRSAAMYHLGAATHLVDDACAPPHEFFLVPNHRAYEERMLQIQDQLGVDRGGVYQADFRVHSGHGGPEWSSAHTRGWVDECAHRAADIVINTAQPTPADPTSGRLDGTFEQFRDTQRLTAGYIQFFFDSVRGP